MDSCIIEQYVISYVCRSYRIKGKVIDELETVGNELWPDLQSVFPYKMEGLRETITPQLKKLISGPGFMLQTLS